jgi:hypothetical protein
MEIARAVGLACWASYLVNGDASGISEQDVFEADAFQAWVGGHVVDIEGETFFGRPDAGSRLAGDCVRYVALVGATEGEVDIDVGANLREAN